MYDYSYNWLILGMNISHTLQNINDSVFSIITDFVISLPDGSDYLLYDVYNQCKLRGGILNITQLGTWRENNGLTIIISDPKIVRRRNYHGMRIKAVGIVSLSCVKIKIYPARVFIVHVCLACLLCRYCIDRQKKR